MKNRMIIALLCGSQLLFADNLETREGTVFQDVTIISADPERMLIVHVGGGCQVKYTDLVLGALSDQQRKAIENGLKEYTERQIRLEQLRQKAEILRIEQEVFARSQQEKGLILFEGDWMKPVDRQEVLASRELERLERELLSVELAKQKAELRKEQLLVEQEQQRLNAYRRSRNISFYYSYPSRSIGCGCGNPGRCRHSSSSYTGNSFHSTQRKYGGQSIYSSSIGSSTSYGRKVYSSQLGTPNNCSPP
jgi:hypothetical protein